MYLKKIKDFISKFKNKRKRNTQKSRLLLSKMDQTTFIKKRKNIKLNYINIDKLKFLGNNNISYYLLVIFIFIAIFLYILLGPIFKVKNIEIVKQENITNMIIAYKSVEKYRNTSIFYLEEKDILNRLKDYQQNIENIDINIDLPDTLKISIGSYKALFNTTINDKTFLITENGTLIPQVYSEELKELKIIKEFDKNTFMDYKKVLNTEFLDKIASITEQLKENIIETNIVELKYYVIEREIHVTTDKNTILIFSLDSDIKEQIEKITIFNKEQLNINKTPLVYIDLRIKNKVFYCTTEEEYQCYQNLKSVYGK